MSPKSRPGNGCRSDCDHDHCSRSQRHSDRCGSRSVGCGTAGAVAIKQLSAPDDVANIWRQDQKKRLNAREICLAINECKASYASLPSFSSHWCPIGDTFTSSHFSPMRLNALLSAVVMSAAGLVMASAAEAKVIAAQMAWVDTATAMAQVASDVGLGGTRFSDGTSCSPDANGGFRCY